MEVRIGVRQVSREVTFESDLSPEEIQKALSAAIESGGMLSLADDRGGTVLVPIDALGYLEIGASEKGRVGFGSH